MLSMNCWRITIAVTNSADRRGVTTWLTSDGCNFEITINKKAIELADNQQHFLTKPKES